MWRVNGTPSVYLVDGDERIRYKFGGKERIDEGLEPAIRSLLKERAPKP